VLSKYEIIEFPLDMQLHVPFHKSGGLALRPCNDFAMTSARWVQSSFEGRSFLCQLLANTCRNIDGLTPGISPGEDTNRDKERSCGGVFYFGNGNAHQVSF
jgi:hypothetical protein